jgi:hypothetical protein
LELLHRWRPDAERWVHARASAVLHGRASTVAAAIRRKATCLGLTTPELSHADRCADYLLNKRDHLDYPTALAQGGPIATGVIEGACRHLVNDRMDITGAGWDSPVPRPSSNYERSEPTAISPAWSVPDLVDTRLRGL